MKLSLSGKAEAGTGIECQPGNPLDQLDAGHACPAGGLQIIVKDVDRLTGRNEEIAIQSLKTAVDRLDSDDRLDLIDCRCMTARRLPGTIGAV